MQSIARLGATRLVAVVGVGAAMVAFFVFLTTRIAAPAMSLLYAELDLKDSAQIAQKLDAMSVAYQLRGEGSQILVPADQVARLRMSMAEQGLPRGGSVGYELFDKADSFGSSNAAQNINHVRALEGELERTIAGLGPVQAARVHLVLPRRDLFARDAQEASASIVVKLRGAERLSKGQVASIQQVVASAVPTLKPNRVSVVDGAGTLLARGDGQDANSATNVGAEQYQTDYETRVARGVEDMLERSLGPGRARVDVRAEIDFDRITTNSESFDPESQVVRSTQTVTQNDDSTTGGNDQPVTVTNNLPNQQAAPNATAANQGRTKNARNEETINYEISKTTRSQVREAGEVKRLSVAVLVDGTYTTKPDGTKEYAPRSPDELKQITALVRSAIGYNEKRGDSVEVVNLKFAQPEEPTATATAPTGFLGFEKPDLIHIGETVTLAVVALLVILLVVRPLMFKLLEGGGAPIAADAGALLGDAGMAARPQLPAPAGMQSAISAPAQAALPVPVPRPPGLDQMIDIGQVEGRVAASSIKKIGEIVEKHPEEAVAIVRSWMYQAT